VLQPDQLLTNSSKFFLSPFRMTQSHYNLRRTTNGVQATTPPVTPVTEKSRTTSPLTSLTPEALKSDASVSSRAEKLLYSEVVSRQVSRVSSPPTGRCPGSCPSENPAEAAKPAEALAKTPEVNASTCEKDLQTHSLDMCAMSRTKRVWYCGHGES